MKSSLNVLEWMKECKKQKNGGLWGAGTTKWPSWVSYGSVYLNYIYGLPIQYTLEIHYHLFYMLPEQLNILHKPD